MYQHICAESVEPAARARIPHGTTYQLIVGRIVDDIQDTSLSGGCLQKEIEPSAQLVSRNYLEQESDQADRVTLKGSSQLDAVIKAVKHLRSPGKVASVKAKGTELGVSSPHTHSSYCDI